MLLDFERVARFCTAAGASTLLYVPGRTNRELGRERSYALTVAGVARVEEILGQCNVQSALEPHWATDAGQPDSALRLLEDVPGLGYTIDCSHWVYKGRSLDVVTPLLPRATHFHLRQAAPGRLQTRLEEGTIDREEVFRQAQASDYKGVYCIEYLHDQNLGLDRVDVMTEVPKMDEGASAAGRGADRRVGARRRHGFTSRICTLGIGRASGAACSVARSRSQARQLALPA